MKTLLKHLSCFCLFFIFGANYAIAQNYQHDFDQVVKKVDDLLWYEKVGDIAHIDKVTFAAPPAGKKRILPGWAPETNWNSGLISSSLKVWIPTRNILWSFSRIVVYMRISTRITPISSGNWSPRNTSWSPLNTGVARGMARLLTIISITEDWKTRMSTLVVIIW